MTRPTPSAASGAHLRPRWFTLNWPVVAIALLTLLFFLPSLPNGFVNWDDHEYVIENPWIREINATNLRAIATQARGANYHPLVFLTHLIEYQFWGLWAPGYHAVNLALHILAAVALFALGRELNLDRRIAFLGALWFGIHPLRVESVAWIAERKDVLCAAFYLGALALYLAARRRGSSRLWAAALITYILALLSKPMAVTWPVAVALCDGYLQRPRDLRWWMEKGYFLLPAAAFSAVTLIIQRDTRGIQPDMALDWTANLISAGHAYGFYLWKTVWPVNLSAFYPRGNWIWPIPYGP